MSEFLAPADARTPEGFVAPSLTSIVSAVIALAAREREMFPVSAIHAVLFDLTSREPVLRGLRFSLTGDVCYSRHVQQAIRDLIDWKALALDHDSVVVLEGIRLFRVHMSRCFDGAQVRAIDSASRLFHSRLRDAAVGRAPEGMAAG